MLRKFESMMMILISVSQASLISPHYSGLTVLLCSSLTHTCYETFGIKYVST